MEESRIIDVELSSLLSGIRADLETIVLPDKQQPVFEICGKPNGGGFKMFFLTTNYERTIMSAIEYDIMEVEPGKITIVRTALNPEGTAMLQKLLAEQMSFENLFERISSERKRVYRYRIALSDFRIRVAVKTQSGNVVLTYPNAKTFYTPGTLVCEKGNQTVTHSGNLFFFDVTARALVRSDAVKFNAMRAKKSSAAKDFLFSRSRTSFLRIVPVSP
jgi:hypothetical protein